MKYHFEQMTVMNFNFYHGSQDGPTWTKYWIHLPINLEYEFQIDYLWMHFDSL